MQLYYTFSENKKKCIKNSKKCNKKCNNHLISDVIQVFTQHSFLMQVCISTEKAKGLSCLVVEYWKPTACLWSMRVSHFLCNGVQKKKKTLAEFLFLSSYFVDKEKYNSLHNKKKPISAVYTMYTPTVSQQFQMTKNYCLYFLDLYVSRTLALEDIG